MNTTDTIAAIATPIGTGGIGIIKISGSLAAAVARSLFTAHKRSNTTPLPAHRLIVGHLCDPHTHDIIDEVLLAFMPGPNSYTREDIVEIHCHSGLKVLERILAAVLNHPGVRLAEPGEFTRRAFLNGRIDLTQAEAILDIISARTATALQKAAGQLGGGLQDRIMRFKQDLAAVLVQIESAIDFPEEDLDLVSHGALKHRLSGMRRDMLALLATYEEGRLLREGACAVILGCPNVGKSSLLNALVEEDRAIVCAVPGTTRDTIEESISIRGVPFKLVDTAGLSADPPMDPVEAQGMDRTRRQAGRADVVLLVLDGSRPVSTGDMSIVEEYGQQSMIVVINKSDLHQELSLPPVLEHAPCVRVSARYHDHMDELRGLLVEQVLHQCGDTSGASVVINRLRHRTSLEKACRCLDQALEGADKNLSLECMAFDIHEALSHLGELVGEITPEDILDQIFAEFCIGK